MRAANITSFRKHLEKHDPENLKARRELHENYEWLEGYWRTNSEISSFEKFCELFGGYIWQNTNHFELLANGLAKLGPIGNSRKLNYEPAIKVINSTLLVKNNEGTPAEKFTATMKLVRQVRNNLFHGQKLELPESKAYSRNKELVRLSRDLTKSILEVLENAEEKIGI